MGQMMLTGMPPTKDEAEILARIEEWGEIRFDDLVFQMRWRTQRCADAFGALIDRGLICRTGIVGAYQTAERRDKSVW
jgi:hypothetical protein